MRNFIARFQLAPAERSGIAETQLKSAFERAQLQNFPFVGSSLIILFLLYALIQGVVLRESQAGVMVIVALGSALVIWSLRRLALHGQIAPNWINRLYAFTAGLVLLSMMLRLFFTGDPKQSANLAFFLVGIGMLLLTMRWFLLMTAITLAGWLAAIFILPPSDEWIFYGVVMAAAAVTGGLAQIVLTRTYGKSEILRLENEKLYEQTQEFNRQLEEKVAERTLELRAAYNQLERLDKTKGDFITIASHELRTPLTILHAHNQMLLDDDSIQGDESLLKRVQGIDVGAARMEEVVEAMLDVAKIDTQALMLHPEPVNLSLLIKMVGQQFRGALAKRNLMLQIDDLRALPEIEADTAALQKVFQHLLNNAIKYTPDGGRITISGRTHPPNGAAETVEIVVTDSGIGISPEVQPLIFEKFYQTGPVTLHSSGKTSFKGGGSGLGLAIAKGIVGAHNGRIWVESQGHDEETCPGSAFHLTLPVRHPV